MPRYKCQKCKSKFNDHREIVNHYNQLHPNEPLDYIDTYPRPRATVTLDSAIRTYSGTADYTEPWWSSASNG